MDSIETEKLQSIIKGYACNLQAERKHKGDLDYAEIEFPLSLLQAVYRELSFRGNETFPVLEKHEVIRDFNLGGLIRHLNSEYGRMGCLNGYELSEIISVRITGKRVHLDITIRKKG